MFALVCVVHAPPNTECVAPTPPSALPSATTSLSQPDPVRTASRPAISLPSADAAISTAAGSTRSTSVASTPTCGDRNSVESLSAT